MAYKDKYLKYKKKYIELKKMSGGYICDHNGTQHYGYVYPLETNNYNMYNICNCGKWLCFHNGTNLYDGYNNTGMYNNNDCTVCGQTQQNIIYCINNNILGYLAPPPHQSGPFTIVNNNYCVIDNGGNINLQPRAIANIINDIPNRSLSDYFGNIDIIFNNSINVEAYLYPFNYQLPTINPIPPIQLSRITISNYEPNIVKNLFIELQNLYLAPNILLPPNTFLQPNIFLLGVAYTNNVAPGANNENFIDVQLCVSGKRKDLELYDVAAIREIEEECGLEVLPGTIIPIPDNGTGGNQFILNATNVNIQTYTLGGNKDPSPDQHGLQNKVFTTIYGDPTFLNSLITPQLTRTDLTDVQGLVLIRLT
jgi:hypothetical protein